MRKVNLIIKRVLDFLFSLIGIIIISPLLICVALLIKLSSSGPVLFKQDRLGYNGRVFKILKFRTMIVNAEHIGSGVVINEKDDPRVTKIGRFLRATSLDELPQIWDIFIGNMSVIGPRPALWNQDLLTAERDKYGANNVKPGLTGWAQINGRDELELSEKARLDGVYAEKLSFKFDWKCFFGSVHVVGKDDSVVEGGTGEIKKEKARLKRETRENEWISDSFRLRRWPISATP